MKLNEWLWGSPTKIKKEQIYTPTQMQGLDVLGGGLAGEGGGIQQLLQMLMPYLQGGPENFKKFAEPYQQQFQDEVLPGIAEQFAGYGGGMGGGLSSSGFGQALGGASRGFNRDLAQMYEQLRFGAGGQISNLMQQMFGAQPYAYGVQQASPGMFSTGVSSFLRGMGQAAGAGMGG